MKTYLLTRDQHLPVDLATAFGFFADAANLERITPTWLRFAVLTPLPAQLEEGALIDYRLQLRGIPIRWRSEITAWEPPYRFVDEQRSGPYLLWVHEHRLEPAGSGTVVRDRVVYAVPGGELVNRLLVRPELERIFDYRARVLREWAQSLAEARSGTPTALTAHERDEA